MTSALARAHNPSGRARKTRPMMDQVRPKTLGDSLAMALEAQTARVLGHVWPSDRYRADPITYCRDVLGLTLWSKQLEIAQAVVPEGSRVSVRSGHKCGKSEIAAALALWFYCSFELARVVMTSTTVRQVDEILWRALSIRHSRALVPIGGDLHTLARSGLRSDDFREVVGFTAKQAEAVAGISGENLFYIIDEASGVPDLVFEAIEGNRAGGARVLMISNPTKSDGEFARSHTSKRHFYTTIHMSSEETPNVIEGRRVIKGLAERWWVEQKREEWGVGSALYDVRVCGNFPKEETSKVVQIYLVDEAEERWEETRAAGRLHIGLDPTGEGEDEFGMAARRGAKALAVRAERLLTDDEKLEACAQFWRTLRDPSEGPPAVKVDTTGGSGGIGSKFAAKLRERYGESKGGQPPEIDVFCVDASAKSPDDAYPLMRDALWFGVRNWLRAGGSLPPERLAGGVWNAAHDKKLAGELTLPTYALDASQRPKVMSKKEMRAKLDRSPDRADALALAIFEPGGSRLPDNDGSQEPEELDWYEAASRGIDPYAQLDATMGGGRRGR